MERWGAGKLEPTEAAPPRVPSSVEPARAEVGLAGMGRRGRGQPHLLLLTLLQCPQRRLVEPEHQEAGPRGRGEEEPHFPTQIFLGPLHSAEVARRTGTTDEGHHCHLCRASLGWHSRPPVCPALHHDPAPGPAPKFPRPRGRCLVHPRGPPGPKRCAVGLASGLWALSKIYAGLRRKGLPPGTDPPPRISCSASVSPALDSESRSLSKS